MIKKKHHRLVFVLLLVSLLMFGFGFALVPIYNRLCKSLGINGRIEQALNDDGKHGQVQLAHSVKVQFLTTQNGTLPWLFYPETKEVTIHPGQLTKLFFYAENQSDHAMVVQAVPSVTPGVAAKFIKKTECFCFRQQTLNGHEAMHMPVLFHLDPDLPASVRTITLSYTLYDVTNRAKR